MCFKGILRVLKSIVEVIKSVLECCVGRVHIRFPAPSHGLDDHVLVSQEQRNGGLLHGCHALKPERLNGLDKGWRQAREFGKGHLIQSRKEEKEGNTGPQTL